MNIVTKIETMAKRLDRAREIVRIGLIYPVYGDEEKRFVCKSQNEQKDGNGQTKLYLVGEKSCTCADFRKLSQVNGGWCKHRLAREILLSQGGEKNARASHNGDGSAQPANGRRTQPTRSGDQLRAARAGS
jgi:hypothetical protein